MWYDRSMLRFLACGAVAAVVVLASSRSAHAYCRTTTESVPANYDPTKNGCLPDGRILTDPKTGKQYPSNYLFWRNQCVSYSINEDASRVADFALASSIIDDAFARWPAATCGPGIKISNIGSTTCDEVRYNADSANQNAIIFRDDTWPYKDAFSTLGLTTVTFNSETGEIFDADMEINSSQTNLVATTGLDVGAKQFDLASVVTHEAGHFFGLAHSDDTTATMFASYKPGTIALRTLAEDDKKGICEIYPDETTRTVSATVSATGAIAAEACNPAPRHGYTKICEEPKKDESCAVTPRAQASSSLSSVSPFAAMGVFGISLLVARRRRR